MIAVVPCGKKKATTACPACNLYVGNYHRANLRYAAAVFEADRIYILSAKYGLIRPTKVIAPYDLRLGQPGSVKSAAIRAQAIALGVADEAAVFFGGLDYFNLGRDAFGRAVRIAAYMALPKQSMVLQRVWLTNNVGAGLPSVLLADLNRTGVGGPIAAADAAAG